MSLWTQVTVLCLCLALYNAEDLHLGSGVNAQLGYQEIVKLGSVPLSVRTKNVFYNSNNTKTIKSISAVDIDKSKAVPTVTAGGIGSSFVNVRLKSEKGKGLNYLVQIFV
ncbi:unnamed protein product [Spodoptera exigua]|uniref:REPAT33 n=1 Tax=Spodoptera exigua TaxID=7107 RepID=I0B5V3_SPOEX|nr:REPAT33 [Spodoptera exigua]KAF9420403.1 hypothetical protein HW555_003325 [Spodoptera exigua]KAH9641815.1 hypothetical protein HF086_005355 [Spodoptera exigua]CAH0700242.1 unnamed protein product [Spodoptera exigua]